MNVVAEYLLPGGLIAILCIACYVLCRFMFRVAGHFAPGALGLGVIVGLCAINYVAFRYFAGSNYFVWFLEKGPLITLSFAIIAVIWDDLNLNTFLLEPYPPRFIAGCLHLAGAFLRIVGIFWQAVGRLVQAIGAYLKQPEVAARYPDGTVNSDNKMSGSLFDAIASLGMTLLVLVAVVMWCLVVAPLLYFVHLVSAAPARMAIVAKVDRLIVRREEDGHLQYNVVAQPTPLPAGAGEISFTKKPFALTSALSAALLSILKYCWDRGVFVAW